MPKPKQTRHRRTHDEMIADLQAKIEAIKKRAVTKKATKSPSLKFTIDAVRSIDMALNNAPEQTLKKALIEAREPLTAYLAMEGIAIPKRRGRKPGSVVAKGNGKKAVPAEEAVSAG